MDNLACTNDCELELDFCISLDHYEGKGVVSIICNNCGKAVIEINFNKDPDVFFEDIKCAVNQNLQISYKNGT